MALWLRTRLLIRPSKDGPARTLGLWGVLLRECLWMACRPSLLVLLDHLEGQTILLFKMRKQLLLLVVFVGASSVTASRAFISSILIESALLDIQVRPFT